MTYVPELSALRTQRAQMIGSIVAGHRSPGNSILDQTGARGFQGVSPSPAPSKPQNGFLKGLPASLHQRKQSLPQPLTQPTKMLMNS